MLPLHFVVPLAATTFCGPLNTLENRELKRPALAFTAGLLIWVVVASVLNRVLRLGMPGYVAAEPAFAFTHAMLWARLALGAVSSLTAGFVVARLAPTSERLPLALSALLLALFIPLHYELWGKFPIWYHLLFLGSLIPLVMLGAQLRTRRKPLASPS